MVFQTIAGQPQGDQRVVVWPDRTVVVGNRAVARFARGDRADPPAGKESRIQQRIGHLAGALGRRQVAEEQMSGIRTTYQAGFSGTVDCERVVAEREIGRAHVWTAVTLPSR